MSAATAPKRRKLEYERVDGSTGVLVGRYAWALQELIKTGERGVTPIERPAPRWSHYIFILRKEHGFHIETIEERHGGEFAGVHGRYVLRENVYIHSDTEKPATLPQARPVPSPELSATQYGRLSDYE